MLSVLATSAILAQPAAEPSIRGQLMLALRIAGATTLATAPLVIWCFGQLPWIGVLANLLLVPVGSCLLLPVASLHAVIAALGFQGELTGRVLTVGCDAFLNTCVALTAWSPPWTIPPLDLAEGVALAVAVAALFVVRSVRSACAVLCAAAIALGALEYWLRVREQPRGELRATFLDVGQGDAALIDLPDGRLMLVDAGGNPGGGIDPGAAVLVPILRARRRDRIDIAVLTHPHPDHYGGLSAVLDHFAVRELWDSGQAEAESGVDDGAGAVEALLKRARKLGTRVQKPGDLCDRPLDAAGARITVLAPCPAHDPGLDPNDNSLVVRVEYRGRSILLMGDAEAYEEAALIASGAPLRADVLKVGHHGSRTSSSEELLSAVRPHVAVISAGTANLFGHPHAEVVERLTRTSQRVVNLAEAGGIQITIDASGQLRVE
jgi:competence protein ComEC